MDVYSLTRKQRPSHLTLGQSSRPPSENDSAFDVSVSPSYNYIYDDVTGSPTRDHWKKDSDSSHCELIGCTTSFGLFERRHHCRKCGGIFCSAHCSNYFRLDQLARFHPGGILSRGCDSCATDFVQWQNELRKQKSNKDRAKENKIEDRASSLLKRHAGIMTRQPQAMEGVTELGRDDIVPLKKPLSKGISINKSENKTNQDFNPIPSVPADWQWSTF